MDIEEVQQLGRLLQVKAGDLAGLARDLDRKVAQSAWTGPDAQRFKGDWWPKHRGTLDQIADQIKGFGQSALNNAAEQDHVSGGASGTSGSTLRVTTNPGMQGPTFNPQGTGGHGPGSGPATPVAPTVPASPAGAHGSSPYDAHFGTPGDTEAAFVREWRPRPNGMDQWNFAYNAKGDCTSFVAWRLNNLAHAAGHADYSFTNNNVTLGDGNHTGLRFGNGGDWNTTAAQLGVVGHQPVTGAVAQWPGTPSSPDGHVAIVREVRPDGSILVEESVWGRDVYGTREIRPGDAKWPPNFLDLLPG